MIASCPLCHTRWRVPAHRVGPGGARIRCASCDHAFAWRPERAVTTPWLEAAPLDEEALRRSTPEAAARVAVEELGAAADRIVDADRAGRLFAREGPALVAAFARYRALAGARAPAPPFRAALRERLGVDLPEWEDRG